MVEDMRLALQQARDGDRLVVAGVLKQRCARGPRQRELSEYFIQGLGAF